VNDLIRSVNINLMKQKESSIYTLTIPSFRYFLLDLAIYVFPATTQPLATSLFQLLNHFKRNDRHPSSLYQDLDLLYKEDVKDSILFYFNKM
jgi:hypothetical protein